MEEIAAQQRRVRVPEGFGTLNEAIRNDTTANGQRKDPNTVYVLKRGGVYVLSGTIQASGFNLNLEAEAGDGPRPYVLMGFLTGAAQVEESIKIFNNLSMKSVYLTNINEFNTYIGRMISVDSPDSRLEFYDCIFDGSGQTFIRLNSAGSKIYMRNCTVSRMGRPSNPDNGRVIDDRGNQVDSIVVENNTWYNITSRVIRDGGAEIDYARFNQNTFVNIGQRFAAIGAVNKLIFTNNIIVNPRFYGNSPTSSTVSLEFSATGESPLINLNYNNIFYTSDILSVWDEVSQQQTTPIVKPPIVTPENQPLLDAAVGILDEALAFTSGPVSPVEIIRISELGTGSTVPDWDWTGAINTLPWQLNAIAYHNFSYPNSSQSFTGSDTNEPLGDLRWFPQFDITWNLEALIREAESLILAYSENAVIDSNPTALSMLEAQIADSKLVANDPGTTRAQTAASINELKAAIQDFKNSFVITQLEDRWQEEFRVFPNPAQNFLYVPNLTGRIDEITIVNPSGQPLLSQAVGTGVLHIDITQVKSGLLIIQFKNQNRVLATQKLIKQ